MRVARANFGFYWIYTKRVAAGVVLDWARTECLISRGLLHPLTGDTGPVIPPESGPFELADFGNRRLRLSWPTGACSISPAGGFSYWEQRFAAWMNESLYIVDAKHSRMMKFDAPDLFAGYSPTRPLFSHAGSLWIECSGTLLEIEYTEIEELLGQLDYRLIDVEVCESYPVRDLGRVGRAEIVGIARKTMRLQLRDAKDEPTREILTVPRYEHAAKGDIVRLFDEVTSDKFREVELPDGSRLTVGDPPVATRTVTAEVYVEPAIDPAGGPIVVGATPSRQADLDRLFGALADNPDDSATLEILVDLLEDSGEPYAELLHELLAGEKGDAKRREALGPLANFVDQIVDRGGLWCGGTLAANAPPDPLIVDKVILDQRFGFFHTLRIGEGPFAVYAKLVGSPRAVGLRHVDVPNAQVLSALIAGKRTQLRHLSNVKFATRAVIEGLADPTFDRVVDLHTETTEAIVAKQLEFFIRDEAGFFKRAPRHLILTERDGRDEELMDPVRKLWDKLPVAAVTCGGLTLKR